MGRSEERHCLRAHQGESIPEIIIKCRRSRPQYLINLKKERSIASRLTWQ